MPPKKKTQSKPAASPAPPTISGRWIAKAAAISLAGAALCTWLTFCLLFWQGSWQLLYHPAATVTRTPASAGLAFDPVAFAATDAGVARLSGWWIPAAAGGKYARYTVLYLHGQAGNLGDCVDELAALHELGLNVLAFDYRGYGQSQFARPNEARWREDAGWALTYLTATRHVAAESILLDGKGLGANLALEVAAAHPELAGVVVESPLQEPVDAIFGDPRAGLVPAKLLVRDRYDAVKAGEALLVPSLWLMGPEDTARGAQPAGYGRVTAEKMLVELDGKRDLEAQRAEALGRWLDDLPGKKRIP